MHANDLMDLRELRNSLSHEYVVPDINALFERTLQIVPKSLNLIAAVKTYCTDKDLLLKNHG